MTCAKITGKFVLNRLLNELNEVHTLSNRSNLTSSNDILLNLEAITMQLNLFVNNVPIVLHLQLTRNYPFQPPIVYVVQDILNCLTSHPAVSKDNIRSINTNSIHWSSTTRLCDYVREIENLLSN